MVEKRKSEKDHKSEPDDVSATADNDSTSEGLAASLDALMAIADKGESKKSEDVIQMSSRKERERDQSAGSAKDLVDELNEKYSTERETAQHKAPKEASTSNGQKDSAEPKDSEEEALGVVELLGALKSDIDSLRQENEAFKAQLMNKAPPPSGGAGESNEVRDLLEALKADIGNLRHESDVLRTQAFAVQKEQVAPEPETNEEADELYSMLAELKKDIVSLRSENEALAQGNRNAARSPSSKKNDEVAMMLHELKSDINDLKHDNEALRLENLTARDGAHFENLGGQGAYRNSDNGAMAGLLKSVAGLVLVLGAAGGGYYLAKSESGGGAPVVEAPELRPIDRSGLPLAAPVKRTAPVVMAPNKPALAPTNPVVAKTAPPKNVGGSPPGVSTQVEQAMMTRADGLLAARDLGAARMVLVYLARHGSAGAMNRLAQTYDPQYLRNNQFDEDKNGDLTRAIRLYGAASGMGDKAAAARLSEMQ